MAKKWVAGNLLNFHRNRYFGAFLHSQNGVFLVGYIFWVEQGGIRKEAVLELEDIGVSS